MNVATNSKIPRRRRKLQKARDENFNFPEAIDGRFPFQVPQSAKQCTPQWSLSHPEPSTTYQPLRQLPGNVHWSHIPSNVYCRPPLSTINGDRPTCHRLPQQRTSNYVEDAPARNANKKLKISDAEPLDLTVQKKSPLKRKTSLKTSKTKIRRNRKNNTSDAEVNAQTTKKGVDPSLDDTLQIFTDQNTENIKTQISSCSNGTSQIFSYQNKIVDISVLQTNLQIEWSQTVEQDRPAPSNHDLEASTAHHKLVTLPLEANNTTNIEAELPKESITRIKATCELPIKNDTSLQTTSELPQNNVTHIETGHENQLEITQLLDFYLGEELKIVSEEDTSLEPFTPKTHATSLKTTVNQEDSKELIAPDQQQTLKIISTFADSVKNQLIESITYLKQLDINKITESAKIDEEINILQTTSPLHFDEVIIILDDDSDVQEIDIQTVESQTEEEVRVMQQTNKDKQLKNLQIKDQPHLQSTETEYQQVMQNVTIGDVSAQSLAKETQIEKLAIKPAKKQQNLLRAENLQEKATSGRQSNKNIEIANQVKVTPDLEAPKVAHLQTVTELQLINENKSKNQQNDVKSQQFLKQKDLYGQEVANNPAVDNKQKNQLDSYLLSNPCPLEQLNKPAITTSKKRKNRQKRKKTKSQTNGLTTVPAIQSNTVAQPDKTTTLLNSLTVVEKTVKTCYVSSNDLKTSNVSSNELKTCNVSSNDLKTSNVSNNGLKTSNVSSNDLKTSNMSNNGLKTSGVSNNNLITSSTSNNCLKSMMMSSTSQKISNISNNGQNNDSSSLKEAKSSTKDSTSTNSLKNTNTNNLKSTICSMPLNRLNKIDVASLKKNQDGGNSNKVPDQSAEGKKPVYRIPKKRIDPVQRVPEVNQTCVAPGEQFSRPVEPKKPVMQNSSQTVPAPVGSTKRKKRKRGKRAPNPVQWNHRAAVPRDIYSRPPQTLVARNEAFSFLGQYDYIQTAFRQALAHNRDPRLAKLIADAQYRGITREPRYSAFTTSRNTASKQPLPALMDLDIWL